MQKAKIVVNLSRIGKRSGGLAVFSKQVVQCLQAWCPIVVVSPETDTDCTAPSIRVPQWIANTPEVSRARPVLWLLYTSFWFPEKHRRILSTTHHAIPGARRQIISILDLRPYFAPDSFMQRAYFHYFLPRAARAVDGILTISEVSKRLIVSVYGVSPDKVRVVPIGVDVSRFRPLGQSMRKEESYLLCIGATWAHKNVHELLSHHEFWSHRYRLLVTAGQGAYRRRLQHLTSQLGIAHRVQFLHFLDEREMVRLYQGASALVYPSLMEGFGIPPLEAMACGVPVIASDIEVFREIYGEIPIYVTLGDPASWKAAFETLDRPSAVEHKIQEGLKIAGSYTEERMCEGLKRALLDLWPDLSHTNAVLDSSR
jgi:glycosyltransferase involved in cell wall biosynthesis